MLEKKETRNVEFTQLLIKLAEDIKSAIVRINDIINLCNSLAERINILLKNIKFSALYDKKGNFSILVMM